MNWERVPGKDLYYLKGTEYRALFFPSGQASLYHADDIDSQLDASLEECLLYGEFLSVLNNLDAEESVEYLEAWKQKNLGVDSIFQNIDKILALVFHKIRHVNSDSDMHEVRKMLYLIIASTYLEGTQDEGGN
jgi:hypothetical protein